MYFLSLVCLSHQPRCSFKLCPKYLVPVHVHCMNVYWRFCERCWLGMSTAGKKINDMHYVVLWFIFCLRDSYVLSLVWYGLVVENATQILVIVITMLTVSQNVLALYVLWYTKGVRFSLLIFETAVSTQTHRLYWCWWISNNVGVLMLEYSKLWCQSFRCFSYAQDIWVKLRETYAKGHCWGRVTRSVEAREAEEMHW